MTALDWKYTRHDKNEALKRIRSILSAGGTIRSAKHFRDRAVERDFTLDDAMSVLKRGSILNEPEEKNGTWRYRVETQKMWVAVAFNELGNELILLTALWITTGRKL